jgi:hypothetical protein
VLDFNSTTTLSIQRPQKGLTPFEVDLRLAYEGEARMKEIATATTGNALHLASVFARSYDSLGRAFGHLYKEVGSATIDSRKRKAKLVLDEAPRIAKEKGLATSRSPSGAEDVRDAICYADEEYCRIEEYRNSLEAAKELVFCKLQAMRMAYDAVRSLVRGTGAVAGNSVTHTAATQDDLLERALDKVHEADSLAPAPVEIATEPTPVSAPRARGFGTPVYRD